MMPGNSGDGHRQTPPWKSNGAVSKGYVMKHVLSVGGTIVFASIASSAGSTQPTVSTSGTLTCTVSNALNKPGSTAELSCDFKTLAGMSSDYSGLASTKSGTFPIGKHVFVWSVVAIGAGKAPLLEGTYRSETGPQKPAVLVGGTDGTTRLEPVTGNEQIAGPAEITTLSLRLAATKTQLSR